jgi:peptide/nickel transport system substrate-binding protein
MTERKEAWPARLALVAVVALAVTACGVGGSGSGGGTPTKGGTATFALAPDTKANYIFPMAPIQYFSVANFDQFQVLMVRPLYWFGNNGTVALNDQLSLAAEPQYSDDGKTVTIRLKNYRWSNGQPVTSRDVEFWMNLLKANKTSYAAYLSGGFPDNVVGMRFPDSQTAVFTLDKQYSSYFFTYNQLSEITPIPQAVWDRTSVNGPIGDYDRTPDGATAVYSFLDSQAKDLSTYATNPLWQVVDGPWHLKSFSTDGTLEMVPNPSYSGPVKAQLASFKELPFTTDSAEFNVLRAGQVDYGYIPVQDLAQRSYLSSRGYSYQPWTGWQITYVALNNSSPTVGPIFDQLYVRQAMQHLIDEEGWIKNILKDTGYPTYGPVPLKPTSKFLDAAEQKNSYPFDAAKAVSLLKAHGWDVKPDGVSTCQSPGTGASQCGDGIAAGTKLQFALQYASGSVYLQQEMEAMKSEFSKAGIQLNLTQQPFDSVIANAVPCTPGKPCGWDVANWGGGWIYAPDYFPTGDEIFATGAGNNNGAFSDPKLDQLIAQTTTDNSLKAIQQYEDYGAQDLPVLWTPVAQGQLSEIRTSLHGTGPQDPIFNLTPENWFFTK